MEYCNGGSLFGTVRTQRRLKESMARWFFQQLILAVDYTHKRGVANRDIKLENLLLHVEEGLPHPLVKMCDFGYSKADFRSAAKSQVRQHAISRRTRTYSHSRCLVTAYSRVKGFDACKWPLCSLVHKQGACTVTPYPLQLDFEGVHAVT